MDHLERPNTEGTPPIGPGPTSGQLAFNLQPTAFLIKYLLENASKTFFFLLEREIIKKISGIEMDKFYHFNTCCQE